MDLLLSPLRLHCFAAEDLLDRDREEELEGRKLELRISTVNYRQQSLDIGEFGRLDGMDSTAGITIQEKTTRRSRSMPSIPAG